MSLKHTFSTLHVLTEIIAVAVSVFCACMCDTAHDPVLNRHMILFTDLAGTCTKYVKVPPVATANASGGLK